jgi:hypothetical protein
MTQSQWWISETQSVTAWNRVLWNAKVYYRVHNSPPTVSILSQMNPMYTTKPYLAKVYFTIVLPFAPKSSECSIPFRLSKKKNCEHFSHLPRCPLHTPSISSLG